MTTYLTNDSETALRVGYEVLRVKPIMHGVSFERYARNFAGWRVRAIERDGKCIGATYDKDCEFHMAVLPEYHGRWMTKGVIRQMWDMPRVIVRPLKKDHKVYGYLRRFGFADVGEDTLILEPRHAG